MMVNRFSELKHKGLVCFWLGFHQYNTDHDVPESDLFFVGLFLLDHAFEKYLIVGLQPTLHR